MKSDLPDEDIDELLRRMFPGTWAAAEMEGTLALLRVGMVPLIDDGELAIAVIGLDRVEKMAAILDTISKRYSARANRLERQTRFLAQTLIPDEDSPPSEGVH